MVASLQVLHDESHGMHTLPSVAYFPAGQLETHAPLSKNGVPLKGQSMQAVERAPLQVWHDVWHSLHLPWPLTTSANVSAGQLATQVPP